MPMNTRSGAPPATPAVASRATKSTPAKEASKAKEKRTSRLKSNKATTNRVQKRAPTTRKARRYVVVDEDSRTVVSDTSRTASPDYISDTPIPRRREIPEKPPPSSRARLEAENARLRKELRYQRDRDHSGQRRSDDLEDDVYDPERGDGPRVSFVYHYAGNEQFLSIYSCYPAVNIKHFKQIFWGTFHPNQSSCLAHNALTWGTGKKEA